LYLLIELTNICAHGAVLFDHTLYNRLKNGPAVNTTTENANQMFTIVQVICFVMNSISQNRANDLKNEIKQFFNQHKCDNIIHCIIENCVGYKIIF
jgi:abortive infection bacteriophage resistance protein